MGSFDISDGKYWTRCHETPARVNSTSCRRAACLERGASLFCLAPGGAGRRPTPALRRGSRPEGPPPAGGRERSAHGARSGEDFHGPALARRRGPGQVQGERRLAVAHGRRGGERPRRRVVVLGRRRRLGARRGRAAVRDAVRDRRDGGRVDVRVEQRPRRGLRGHGEPGTRRGRRRPRVLRVHGRRRHDRRRQLLPREDRRRAAERRQRRGRPGLRHQGLPQGAHPRGRRGRVHSKGKGRFNRREAPVRHGALRHAPGRGPLLLRLRVHPRRRALHAACVADAFEHAHGLGVINRDAKPENIVIDA